MPIQHQSASEHPQTGTRTCQTLAGNSLLDQIREPADLRKLNGHELEQVAAELRSYIIQVVSERGGHIASNLGTIELTLALLRQFDVGSDRIVWDVGHQSYAYKILTGRKEAFKTLRQADGLSGFPKREESPCDAFNTGHSSTSISAALGLLRASQRLQKGTGKDPKACVAVIGDGALTGGMAYEALDDIRPAEPLIVIINDNQMSIDPNVGGLRRHLDQVRTNKHYLKFKAKMAQILERSYSGRFFMRILESGKRLARRLLRLNSSWFECLGLRYYGPIDGHNLEDLERYMRAAKSMKRPVVLHVITQKGRGYAPAEAEPALYHGVAPLKVKPELAQQYQTKKPNLAEMQRVDLPDLATCRSFSEAFGVLLTQRAKQNERIVAVTAAMAQGTGLSTFQKYFPDRCFDVGIAEAHAVTMAAGMAAGGLQPVVAIYSTFLQRALDQLLHDCVLQNLPVVFAIDRAGIVGDDGETHQGLYDTSFLTSLPGMTVLCPRDYSQLASALDYALALKKPVAIRYPKDDEKAVRESMSRLAYPVVSSPAWPAAEQLRQGKDLAFISWGGLLPVCLQAAERLQAEGYQIAVLDARSLKPLPWEDIDRLGAECPRLLCVEEVAAGGSLAQALALRQAQEAATFGMKAQAKSTAQASAWKLRAIHIKDEPVNQASVAEARRRQGLDADSIVAFARRWLQETNE